MTCVVSGKALFASLNINFGLFLHINTVTNQVIQCNHIPIKFVQQRVKFISLETQILLYYQQNEHQLTERGDMIDFSSRDFTTLIILITYILPLNTVMNMVSGLWYFQVDNEIVKEHLKKSFDWRYCVDRLHIAYCQLSHNMDVLKQQSQ